MSRIPPRLAEPIRQLSQLPPVNPYEEEAKERVIPKPGHDPRPYMVREAEKVLIPRYNELYDTLRTRGGWKYMADGLATGTITTTPGATAQASVTLAKTPNWRLEQWPGAVQVYLCIRFFGIVPQTVPTANAGLEVLFYDQGGNIAPLGEYLAQAGGNASFDTILPTPITDPGKGDIGTITVALSNVASSGGTYNWSIGFSAAYLLPARYGYEILDQERYEGNEWTRKERKEEKHD
jgi:hypothetical protein